MEIRSFKHQNVWWQTTVQIVLMLMHMLDYVLNNVAISNGYMENYA